MSTFSDSEEKVLYVKHTDRATEPSKGSPDAAGFDLYSAYSYVVPALGKQLIETDLKIATFLVVPNITCNFRPV